MLGVHTVSMTAATYDPLTDETNVIIAAMLTENTGSSFLDSGSAYGRNHERQAGKTVADFRAEPEVEVKFWGTVPGRDSARRGPVHLGLPLPVRATRL
jgi:hypothetical protein